MEAQPDAVSEDQVVVITSRTGDGLGLLGHKPANCHSLSSQEVGLEGKYLPPTEAGFLGERSMGNKNPRPAHVRAAARPGCLAEPEVQGERSELSAGGQL